VKDTSNAFLRVLESDPELVNGQIFNVGSDEQNVQVFDLANLVAGAIKLPFNYEWYGTPDRRSYKVSFDKIKRALKYRADHSLEEGAKEVYDALKEGKLNPDDPKTITVKWYRNLLEMQAFLKDIEVKGAVL